MAEVNKPELTIEDILGEGFSKDLEQLTKNSRERKRLVAQIPYEWFVENALPYFAGAKEDPDFVSKWVSFLQGPNVTANVVKDGEIYLTIDPIIKPLNFNIGTERVPAFAVFDEYKKMALINPSLAVDRMKQSISGWYKENNLEDLYNDLSKWNRVFAENGFPTADLSSIELLLGIKDKESLNEKEEDQQSKNEAMFGDEW